MVVQIFIFILYNLYKSVVIDVIHLHLKQQNPPQAIMLAEDNYLGFLLPLEGEFGETLKPYGYNP